MDYIFVKFFGLGKCSGLGLGLDVRSLYYITVNCKKD